MWKRNITIRALLTAVALVLVAQIAHADPTDVMHACARKDGGALRVADTCRRGERVVSWNERGPAGPVGPRGPEGPAAPTTATAGSISDAHRVDGQIVPGGATPGDAPVACPAGEVVLSGSAQLKADSGTPWIVLGIDLPPDRADHLGRSMFILFDGYDWPSEGDALVQWTMLCAAVI